jgi:hypothetical protein
MESSSMCGLGADGIRGSAGILGVMGIHDPVRSRLLEFQDNDMTY